MRVLQYPHKSSQVNLGRKKICNKISVWVKGIYQIGAAIREVLLIQAVKLD